MFDPACTDFRTLLEFFQIHNPTKRDRQGNDRGASYRSAIFYTDEAQKPVAPGVAGVDNPDTAACIR